MGQAARGDFEFASFGPHLLEVFLTTSDPVRRPMMNLCLPVSHGVAVTLNLGLLTKRSQATLFQPLTHRRWLHTYLVLSIAVTFFP